MSSPNEKFKKSNEEDEKANKTAYEKWVEGYNSFLSQEGQDEYHQRNKTWKASARKCREETADNVDEPIQILLVHFKCIQTSL